MGRFTIKGIFRNNIFLAIILCACIFSLWFFWILPARYLSLCSEGSTEELKRFLETYHPDINQIFVGAPDDFGCHMIAWPEEQEVYPLLAASRNKDSGVLRLVLEHGAQLNPEPSSESFFDPKGFPALALALDMRCTENVLILLEARKKAPDIQGNRTALEPCLENLVNYLYFYPDPPMQDKMLILERFFEEGAFGESRYLRSALESAAVSVREPEFFIFLKQHGVDYSSMLPLLFSKAARWNRSEKVVQFFLDEGGDPEMLVSNDMTRPHLQNTPLIRESIRYNLNTKIPLMLIKALREKKEKESR